MSDFVIGLIRTWVPIGVGAVISWLIATGMLDADSGAEVQASLVIGLTGLIQGAYYFLVRILAERWPWVGNFLGYNKAPTYNG